MTTLSISVRTVCGLDDLGQHSSRGVTHVLSILDPEHPDPDAFGAYRLQHRTTLRFHDAIEPGPGIVLPEPEHVEAVLAFGRDLESAPGGVGHLLVHCHAGISRSTAAMALMLAQAHPDEEAEAIFDRLLEIRPQAWPNSRMIAFGDAMLDRRGALSAALPALYRRRLGARPELVEIMARLNRSREIEMARAEHR